MFRKVIVITIIGLLVAGCAPRNEYDEQLTAIQCTVENNQHRFQYMMCVQAIAAQSEVAQQGTPASGAQTGIIAGIGPGGMVTDPGPGGMVTDPGPGGMVTDPGPGGMVTDPGSGLFFESNNAAVRQCRSANSQLRGAVTACQANLTLCINGGSCNIP